MSHPEVLRVLLVLGTRPEAVKLAPVARALTERGMDARILLTGQHRHLVRPVLDEFALTPWRDLDVMLEGQSPGEVGAACLTLLPAVLEEWPPQLLLVQGDTASVFFGAMAAFLARIPVGHVEAGLRSGRKDAPFPEEIFRRLVSPVADLHFPPTPRARDALLKEGIPQSQVYLTGNPVVDAVRFMVAREPSGEPGPEVKRYLEWDGQRLLLTLHRRESFGAPIREVLETVRALVREDPARMVLYPVHPNPQVREPAYEILGDESRVLLTEPLPYGILLRALGASHLALTDSGGIQEEAPALGVPVLVLREVTERPEGVEAGVARLVGTDATRIRRGVEAMGRVASRVGSRGVGTPPPALSTPYGDGSAADRIADVVAHWIRGDSRTTVDWSGA
ncbi:MAG: UDP-N-acetylglucosamine 2-epimerase (non-hydrolyzing) [Gemmatimonadota bacterium]